MKLGTRAIIPPMKASHRIHADQGYVHITLEGAVTLPELAGHVQTVWSDPAWNPGYNGIVDCSNASLAISENELQTLAMGMQTDPRCSLARWAFVVSTATAFAKVRKVEHVADPKSTLRIFFDLPSAERWLLSDPATLRTAGS